jgi:cbb3-type cytochrome oxidase subunit 1
MGGALVVTSFVMFAYNVIATVIVRRPFEEANVRLLPPDVLTRDVSPSTAKG